MPDMPALDGPGTSVPGLRARRLSLRAELVALGRWRRLLRAKVDLTVARGTLPPLPGAMLAGLGTAAPDLSASDLLAACTVTPADFLASDLVRLRTLDGQLAEYETAVRAELMRTTDELVELLTRESPGPFGSDNPAAGR